MSTTAQEVEEFDGLDLDAAIREHVNPDGLPVRFKGEVFTLPAEFPIDVLDPFLRGEFDFVGLVKAIVEAGDEVDPETGQKQGIVAGVVDVLLERPTLPAEVVDAFHLALRGLFGSDQYDRFLALRPGNRSLPALVRGLARKYGVSLGEAFASPSSSDTAGATSSPNSPATTPDSTPETPSAGPEPAPGSSESDASATS